MILGATGGIGGELAAALTRHGWEIKVLHRNPAKGTHASL
ncbi:MAG: NmrA family NAD(P)-binding protein [Steroidobacteraceae bacterium]